MNKALISKLLSESEERNWKKTPGGDWVLGNFRLKRVWNATNPTNSWTIFGINDNALTTPIKTIDGLDHAKSFTEIELSHE